MVKKCWKKYAIRRFAGQTTISSPPKPSCGHQSVWLNATPVQQWWEGHNAAMRGLGKYWPIQPTQAQHRVVQCSYGTCGHITVFVPASCANSAVTLRIDAAGANPLAFCRKADCREMNSSTRNEARKKKSVCGGWWGEKETELKKRKSWPQEWGRVIEQPVSFPFYGHCVYV